MGALWQIVRLPGHAELRERAAGRRSPTRACCATRASAPTCSAAMREGDVLVHHPYDSFATSVERFVEQAVADPNVLAIKQTVYRTSDDSPLVPALIDATERGKQAVALVELKARFDERMNIHWAKAMEEAGVHVVYGQPALKTHAKCVLVVRREGDGVRNYVHIGTGNYHSATARLYTDFGLFTTDEQIGADVADMFNYLTGYGRPLHYRRVLMAPDQLRDGMLDQIERTVEAHRREPPGAHRDEDERARRRALHPRAVSRVAGRRAGRPQRARHLLPAPGRAGHLREHPRGLDRRAPARALARVRLRARRASDTIYISSADLMPRNLDHRVELAAPIESPELRAELLDTLERAFADNQNSWELDDEGRWAAALAGARRTAAQPAARARRAVRRARRSSTRRARARAGSRRLRRLSGAAAPPSRARRARP